MISKPLLLCLGLALGVTVSAEESELKPDPKKEPFKIRIPNFDKTRDPFTFMGSMRPDGPDGPCFIDPEYLMRDNCVKAEWYFKERRFMEAVNSCDKGLKVATDYKASPRVYESEELITRITRLKKAAERMVKRYETENALEKWKLETAGVFAREQALISFNTGLGLTTKVVRVGDKLLDAGAKLDPAVVADAPIVREIQPRRIMIDFRGYKSELPIASDTDELIETPK